MTVCPDRQTQHKTHKGVDFSEKSFFATQQYLVCNFHSVFTELDENYMQQIRLCGFLLHRSQAVIMRSPSVVRLAEGNSDHYAQACLRETGRREIKSLCAAACLNVRLAEGASNHYA